MKALAVALPVLSLIATGLHFFRAGETGLFAACLMLPLLFFVRREWARYVLLASLCLSAAMWLGAAFDISHGKILIERPWIRFAIIMTGVLALVILSAVLLWRSRFEKSDKASSGNLPAFIAFLFTAVFLWLARTKAPFTVLLADRALEGAGLPFILLISTYAAWITDKMVENRATARLRVRIWTLFAAVFFAQLFLGLSGLEFFFMTGRLHVPVPAVVIAGPLYRGAGFFMPMLFITTVILMGPAWCSYLCYFGAWDALAASGKKRSSGPPAWLFSVRVALLVSVAATALLMRALGVSAWHASLAAILFGAAGLGIMAFVSRRKGYMAHCIGWCPLGLLAALGGRLSPFRIRISNSCTDCGACTSSCRYDALRPEHVKRRSPGINCTLCGDCLTACTRESIGYRFPFLSPQTARAVFIVIVVVLHAVFLGIARI